MNKVGIATLFGGHNYGNSLQNYAVIKMINECGFEAVTLQNNTTIGFTDYSWNKNPLYKKLVPSYIIRYLKNRLNKKYGLKNSRDFSFSNINKYKKNANIYYSALNSRIQKFADFRKQYLNVDENPINAKWYDSDNLKNYSAFVCGSDQIWNPYYRQVSSVDFLQFAPKHKRIALSPSFGVSEIPDVRKEDYSNWLNEIPHLSVREGAGAKIIKDLCGIDVPVLIDPTLCLTADKWLSISKAPQIKPQKDFVFCYFLGDKCKKYCDFIEKYAKKHNCEIINLFDIENLEYYDCDPCEFLWLLSNAKTVFTDSFHGTAFSINLNVPFVVFNRVEGGNSMSSRITTLLDKTSLGNRHFEKLDFEKIDTVDFTASNSALKVERDKAFSYLKNALNEAINGNSIYLTNKYHCTGCGACYNACPTSALSMVADSEGFKYPEIDSYLCINCHACEKSCPADCVKPEEKQPNILCGYSKDKDIQKNSSSGGLFTPIAKYVLSQNGVVFGAAFDENFNICHINIVCEEELSKLRTSKYVQSDIGTTYKQAKEFLKADRIVLFTGSPCQIAGLKKYLGKEYDNLITLDIICHGVPSPKAWDIYLDSYHRRKDIERISFRDKTVGWNDFSMRVDYTDGTSYRELATKDTFTRAFLANLNLRPSCHQCQYETVSRVSDITLADYWGVELVHSELKDQQGVSLCLVHTEKGEKLLENINGELFIMPTDKVKSISMNSAATHSVAASPKRTEFFEKFENEPLKELTEKLLKPTFSQKAKLFIRRNGSRVKKVLRKLK